MGFNKCLLLIVSISSLLLSSNALPAIHSTAKPYFSAEPASRVVFKPSSIKPSLSFASVSALRPAASKTVSSVGIAKGSIYYNPAEVITPNQIVKASHHVIEFCKRTENPALCAKTIGPYFQKYSFDPIKALETEILATLTQSVKVSKIITQSMANPSKKTAKALDICKKQYAHIVDTIKEAVQLLIQQNVVDAYYKFSNVLVDRSACEEAFVKSGGVPNPFAEDSQTVYQLGGNCLSIMDGMVNNRIRY